MKRISLLALGLVAFLTMAVAADGADLRLVPFPKEVRLLTGEFSLGRPLVLEAPDAQVEVFARLLKEELQRAGLKSAQIRTNGSPGLAFRLTTGTAPGALPSLPREPHPEFYSLEVRADEVVCTAAQPAGLVHGLHTLCQLIRANRHGDALPCLTIRDWPALRWRAFQDDMTRGPSSKLDTLKFEASLGSYLKLNLMTFYMEYQYAFKKHPQIGPPDGSLTPEDLAALVAYAKPLHLDILGNQQSFGHFGQILKHPEFAALRETSDVLTPVRDETYRLLDDLYSEVCPLLPFPWFNVCCDETYGLGTGPSRELASQIGVGGVYVRHLRRVHDLLKEQYGKRMMMWGDIILQHPDKLQEIPKDTIMLTWGYDARPNFEDQIVPFAKSGYEFFVCPGVSDWSRILPDFGVAVTNIQNFVRDGVKHGALGMINTDWEDDGEALKAVKWHADAWAAECAWNASATPIESFNHRVGAVLFGEAGDHFGQAITLLTRTHRLPAMKGMMNSRFWEDDFVPKAKPAVIQTTASNLLTIVRPALEHLEACRQEARCNPQVIETLLFGARRMELIAQRMLDGLEASQLYENACEAGAGADALATVEQLIRKNRGAHETLGQHFASLWLAESKPYALDWTMRRYTNVVAQYDTLLRKVADARAEVRAGGRLPAPEEIGLAIPRPLSRRLQPRESISTPLAPESPWAEPSATHRLGLVVNANAADRFHLPVEIELTLPSPLVAKAVCVFALNEPAKPTELLAQLDTLSQSGKSRLVLILDQPLRKDEQVSVHVYLGLSQSPRLLPGAVTSRADENGSYWIENDRIRALLGREGAHVYRWEVKSATNRDLTMPGDSGWAGFSDIGSRRQSAYRLNCTARGPAMVEFQCSEPNGHEKTIRFYSGASWMEVFLDEPTPLYWDFDDPRNFAADGPTPGTWLFSNGQSGLVGRAADGVPAQVKAPDTYWGIKFNQEKMALGLITPEIATFHHVAPGSAAGGVGIESSPAAQHFVTFAGMLEASPAETMTRLRSTLDLKQPVSIWLYSLQAR
jgi:hexosaminidase